MDSRVSGILTCLDDTYTNANLHLASKQANNPLNKLLDRHHSVLLLNCVIDFVRNVCTVNVTL